MKHIVLPILAFSLVALSLTGCDWLRKLAGKPTSADIEAIRQKMADDDARQKAVADSVALAEALARKAAADSVAAVDSFSAAGCYFRKPAELGGIKTSGTLSRYAIAVGAFRKAANAQRLSEKYDSEIYNPSVILSGMGLNIVLVCPTDSITVLYGSYAALKNTALCPQDAWILVNEKENDEQ